MVLLILPVRDERTKCFFLSIVFFAIAVPSLPSLSILTPPSSSIYNFLSTLGNGKNFGCHTFVGTRNQFNMVHNLLHHSRRSVVDKPGTISIASDNYFCNFHESFGSCRPALQLIPSVYVLCKDKRIIQQRRQQHGKRAKRELVVKRGRRVVKQNVASFDLVPQQK
jgi:hypothetical protein